MFFEIVKLKNFNGQAFVLSVLWKKKGCSNIDSLALQTSL